MSNTDIEKLLKKANACYCTGPQGGDPVCPCRMRNLTQVDGRWIETIDHGPVAKKGKGQ